MAAFSFDIGRRPGVGRQIETRVLVPESLVLAVRWPGGGLVWNWPVALWVIDGDRVRHLPIIDVTRLAQLGLYVAAGVFLLMAWGWRREQNG